METDGEAGSALVEDWLVLSVEVGSISPDEMTGEYTNATEDFSETSCSLETGSGGAVNSTGEDVTFAGRFMVAFGEAGSVKIGSVRLVGTAMDAAPDKAIGGSHEPRQSRSQVAQAESISRI